MEKCKSLIERFDKLNEGKNQGAVILPALKSSIVAINKYKGFSAPKVLGTVQRVASRLVSIVGRSPAEHRNYILSDVDIYKENEGVGINAGRINSFLSSNGNLNSLIQLTPKSIARITKDIKTISKEVKKITGKGGPLEFFSLRDFNFELDQELASKFKDNYYNISNTFRDMVRSIQVEPNAEKVTSAVDSPVMYGANVESDVAKIVANFNSKIKKA